MTLINIGHTSAKRFLKQNLSDEYRSECYLITQGQHELCNNVPSTSIESTIIKEIQNHSEE